MKEVIIMEKISDVHVTYHPTCYPKRMHFPNDYKYKTYTNEKDLGGEYIHTMIMSGELVCIDEGSYWEPPIYEPDWQEIIIVQPKLIYWGKM